MGITRFISRFISGFYRGLYRIMLVVLRFMLVYVTDRLAIQTRFISKSMQSFPPSLMSEFTPNLCRIVL